MALRLRLRGALSLSSSLLHHHPLHQPQPISSHLLSTPTSHTPAPSPTKLARPFTSTTTLFRKTFDPQTDEIAPDTILFEGCDYNHWLITVDFPRDANISREQMIETYVDTAAQVFGRSRNPTRCSFPFCLYWSSLDFLYTYVCTHTHTHILGFYLKRVLWTLDLVVKILRGEDEKDYLSGDTCKFTLMALECVKSLWLLILLFLLFPFSSSRMK